ncbi:Phosphoheptose isomerase 1 [Alkalibacterium sp. AK22]|uniref:D-sedoheptulose-7-phosphate isomerase n=1 Tax=Alkalibacterium sp. AK22 TaxID=1229520 RepID=UPI00044C9FEE|nr:SIS domain-containing protein [Alkalibacterium sp. AK22]EXJ23741.1 Phosphoheptose isomerase 1 [Alkalibacterium sp. AK22]
MSLQVFIDEYRKDYQQTLSELDSQAIEDILSLMLEARDHDRRIFVLGNGGSAASASHWVCDFNKGATVENKSRFKILCLSDNTPILTALGNDVSYDSVFLEQLKNFLQPDDLVIAMSVSGNSQNLVDAVKYAEVNGGKTLSIIGDYDGELKEVSGQTLTVPSRNYGIVEDVHMYIAHVLSQYISQSK